MKNFRALLAHPFFQGTFIFTALSFFANIFNYIFNSLLARLISVSQFGEYGSALSYLTIFTVPFGALSLILIRKIGSVDHAKRRAYVVALENALLEFFQHKLLHMILGFTAIGAVLYLFANVTLSSTLFILALTVLTFFIILYSAIFQAEKEFLFAGGFLSILSVAKVIGGGLAVFLHSQLWFLYVVIVAAHLIVIGLGRWHIRGRQEKNLPMIQLPKLRTIFFQPNFYLPVITFFGLMGLISFDVMIVKRFFPADDAGLYAALSLLGKIILYVSLPLTTVAFSFFTGSESKQQTKKVLLMSFLLLCLGGVISFLGYSLLPGLVVSIIFGQQYLVIIPWVWLTAVFGATYSLATLLGQYWVAQHHPISTLSFPAAVLQIALLFFFHDNFTQVLIACIACSSLLTMVYLVPLFLTEQTYETAK